VRIIETGQFDVVLTAFNYSLLWQEARRYVVPAARKQKMGVVVGSPLHQGALARRYDDEIISGAPWMTPMRREQFRKLYAFLDEVNLPIAEAGLRFVLSNPDVSSVLMGARSVDEVEQNAKAVEAGPLPEEVLTGLQQIAEMLPFRPYCEPGWVPLGVKGYKGPGGL